MNSIMRKTLLIVLALAAVSYAFAQERSRDRSERGGRSSRYNRSEAKSRGGTNQVPAPGDYEAFSAFIGQRNIFDPNRQPRYVSGPRPQTSTIRKGAPFFMLVGTMSYDKGTFAFFNGNDSEYRQALQPSGKIGDYSVTAITAQAVTLASSDNKSQDLKIGDRMQEENGKWEFVPGDEMNDSGTPVSTDDGSSGVSSSEGATPATASEPAAASGPTSDILKRLMELRAKENQ